MAFVQCNKQIFFRCYIALGRVTQGNTGYKRLHYFLVAFQVLICTDLLTNCASPLVKIEF